MVILSIKKTEATRQTVLLDRQMLKRQNFVKNAKIKNETFWVIFKQCVCNKSFRTFYDHYEVSNSKL